MKNCKSFNALNLVSAFVALIALIVVAFAAGPLTAWVNGPAAHGVLPWPSMSDLIALGDAAVHDLRDELMNISI